MDDEFTEFWNRVPIMVPVPLLPIQDARPGAGLIARARADGVAAVLRWAVNSEQNSRLPVSLAWPAAPVSPSPEPRRTPLPEGLRPASLLTAGDRLAVQGAGRWALFDRAGRLIADRALTFSDLCFDAVRSFVMTGNEDGGLDTWRLASGTKASSIQLLDMRNMDRVFVAPQGARLVITSLKVDVDVHAPPVQHSMIEVVDLSTEPPLVLKNLIRETNLLLTAVHSDSIVLATHRRVYVLDLNLQFKQALSGDFQPLALSLDEAGRIYLAVRAQGPVSLWVLTTRGERLWSFPIPPEGANLLLPPIVGYDHSVYLVTDAQILAVSPEGKLLWRRAGSGRISGAIVTSDDRLVVSEGSLAVAYDTKGTRQLLHDFGEELATPPVLTPDGELIVASRAHLFSLSRPQ